LRESTVTRWLVELSTDAWRLVGVGGHMEIKEMCSRETSLRKYYGVRMVSNISHVYNIFLFPLEYV
jgi:hypothetical protein